MINEKQRIEKQEYETTQELSIRLNLKPPTVYKMAEQGVLPSYKIGKLRRFKISEVDDWLVSCQEGRRKSCDLISPHHAVKTRQIKNQLLPEAMAFDLQGKTSQLEKARD